MKSIAIIYGSSTENTKRAAEKIAERLSEYSPALIDIYDGDEEAFHSNDVLILRISTWGVKDLQDDWSDFYHKLEKMDLTGKTVALFGWATHSFIPILSWMRWVFVRNSFGKRSNNSWVNFSRRLPIRLLQGIKKTAFLWDYR